MVQGSAGMAVPSGSASSSSFLILLLLSSISNIASGGIVGVDYGRVADNLKPPEEVVGLLKTNGITAVSIYDANTRVLRALANTGIKVSVSLPNEQLADAATDPDYAGTWVWENVQAHYPATQIVAVMVGNEVFHQRPDLTNSLVPAMQNVYNGLANLGLAGAIKVSSPVAFSALDVSYPPSEGSFRGDLQPVLREMLGFLTRTGADFMVNIYPYFAYRDSYPNINLDYALGRTPNPGVWDPNTGLTYYSLFDAQLDAVYFATAALGFPIAADTDTIGISQQRGGNGASVPESGWPSRGESPGRPRWGPDAALARGRTSARRVDLEMALQNASVAEEHGASVENAQAYNSNLVKRVLAGKTGTPLHPDADLDVYIFSLFNENKKSGPESERNFGLFYPDGTKVYEVQFRAWCVADPAAGREKLKAALDWACGPQGGANCGPIQPGGPCFEPDTVEAHASHAMNDYYQKHNRDAGACFFNGAGRVVFHRPKFGTCELPSSG